MRRFPKKIAFDPITFIEINKKSNRNILEFILAEFEVFVPFSTLHSYLLGKTYLGKNAEKELQATEEIYKVIFPDKALLTKTTEIEAALIKRGIFMSLEDIITGVSAIVSNAVLICEDVSRYEPLKKYGLSCMSLKKFFEEIEELAKDEARKSGKI